MTGWKEVYPGIYSIREKGYHFYQPNVNLYFILDACSSGILYDAGYSSGRSYADFVNAFRDLKKNLIAQGMLDPKTKARDLVKSIIISHDHFDHSSGAGRLSRLFPDARLITSKAVAMLLSIERESGTMSREGLESRAPRLRNLFGKLFYKLADLEIVEEFDGYLNDGSEIKCGDLRFDVILSDGHSRGQILLLEPEKGILLSSDLVLHDISTWLGPPNSNYEAYFKTMNYLSGLDYLKLILPAHGKLILNPIERIKELIKFRKLRELQILKTCEQKPLSSSDIAWRVYHKRGIPTWLIARGLVELTASYLANEGKLKKIIRGRKVLYSRVN
ncbi:MAG: MBL fold metallo-hydrolase [Promethearchaeota archaeon]